MHLKIPQKKYLIHKNSSRNKFSLHSTVIESFSNNAVEQFINYNNAICYDMELVG